MMFRRRVHDSTKLESSGRFSAVNNGSRNGSDQPRGDENGEDEEKEFNEHDVVERRNGRRIRNFLQFLKNIIYKLTTTPGACLKSIYPSEWLILIVVTVFTYYSFYYHDNLHFHVLRTYAWAGYDEAQHLVGQRYVQGKGVEKHHQKAMEYFKLAADQGHPKSSHNLALGHVLHYTQLEQGEARRLLNHASQHGVKHADTILSEYCDRKQACND